MNGIELVVARDEAGGIGRDGDLPWRLPGDMRHFVRVTQAVRVPGTTNVVVMGRRTWESIPKRFRPLAGRTNIVLSRRPTLELPEGVLLARSLDDALAQAAELPNLGRVFVVGGGDIYAEAVSRRDCRRAFVTQVDGFFDCDTFIDLDRSWRLTAESLPEQHGEIGYRFQVYERT